VLARHSATDAEYTFKAVSKAKGQSVGTRVMQEAKIAMKLVDELQFVPTIVLTIDTDAYLVSAYNCRITTGLHELLQDYGPFEEVTCCFYAANIFLGLEHLHSFDVVYRNVTPEAIKINANGYAVLMDLSFAAEKDGDKLFDLCGLAPYLSPEQVNGTGHTEATDYWALGILVYEMLSEKTPFVKAAAKGSADSSLSEDEQIQSRIAAYFSGSLNYPQAFSVEVCGMLDKLLEPNLASRICTPAAFRAHPWTSIVEWRKLADASAPSPFGPEMRKLADEISRAGSSKSMQASRCTQKKDVTMSWMSLTEEWFTVVCSSHRLTYLTSF